MTLKLELSTAARTALLSAGTSRQGAKTYPRENQAVRAELLAAGLIGDNDGLTMRGTIAREKAVDALLDEFDN
jgi:hypothetical protein